MIVSAAPIRICDIGGWTDTWFAKRGRVLNLGVSPEVNVELQAVRDEANGGVRIRADNGNSTGAVGDGYSPDPLLHACVRMLPPPPSLTININIESEVPAGSSVGTSAATCVAMLAALDRLRGGAMSQMELARSAHRVETELLGQQSGIQDQFAAAFGGISYIEMNAYPAACVTRLCLSEAFRDAFVQRVSLIFLGRRHCSSKIHEQVIKHLEQSGGETPQLERLCLLAEQARNALLHEDLHRFGQLMINNTEMQADLHPALVGESHRQVIEIGNRFGAWGWKVNGAGGDGGSVTILHGPDKHVQRRTIDAIRSAYSGFTAIPIRLDTAGVRVTEVASSAVEHSMT